jgi:glycerol-3-phosphate dehydrogenase subunit B
VGRLFDRDQAVEETAAAIRRAAPEADMVGLPAFIGLAGYARVLPRLMELTGKIIYEVPTLPPSILGLRMDQALKNRLAGQGGLLIPGDRVVGGEIRNGRLASVETQMYGPVRLAADHFILATGSFFSGGLVSRPDRMVEPVFGLEIRSEPLRTHWVGRRFFDPGSHPFLSYGVETDERLRPRMPDGRPLDNLYAAGAVLAGYDPIAEASGGGVAVATGYRAALLVLEEDGDRP